MPPPFTLHLGHVLDMLTTRVPAGTVHTCVTSPPYWGLRDYGTEPVAWPEVSYSPMPGLPAMTIPAMSSSLGMEPTLEAFIGHIVLVFRAVREALHKSGTCWVNMGDAYAGSWGGQGPDYSGLSDRNLRSRHAMVEFQKERAGSLDKLPGLKNKDLQGQPWRIAFALQADGWYLRSDIIWHKPNPMPESISDRPTKSHEYFFLLTKSKQYFYDATAIVEPASQGTHARVSQAAAAALGLDPRDSEFGQPNGWENSPHYHGTNPNGKIRLPGNVKPAKGQKAYEEGDNKQRTKAGLLAYAQKCRASAVEETHSEGSLLNKSNGRKLDTTGYSKNNASMDASMDASLAVMPLTRNKRTVWTVPTEAYSEAHFATFPRALIRPCILAGTSVRGCCPHCSAPWMREKPIKTGKRNARKASPLAADGRQRTQTSSTQWAPTSTPSEEWAPSCGCPEHAPVPCTVLDPFGGSGTTAEVALEEDRHVILCELSEDYAQLIHRRIHATQTRLANQSPKLPFLL